MADIVERLRELERTGDYAADGLPDEAANEIERLRTAILNWYIDPSIGHCGMLEKLAQENQTAPTNSDG